MNAVAAAGSATQSVVYSRPAANDSGSVWLSTVVSTCCRWLMVVEVAKALETPSAASTIPMVKMRPGVVEMNHQRGWAGSAGDRDPFGSGDGGGSSPVPSVQPS